MTGINMVIITGGKAGLWFIGFYFTIIPMLFNLETLERHDGGDTSKGQ